MTKLSAAEATEPLDQWRKIDIIDDEVASPTSEASNISNTEARLASAMPSAIMPDSGAASTTGTQSNSSANSGTSTAISQCERGVQTTESLGSEYDFCHVTRPTDEGTTPIVNNGTLNYTVQKFYQVNAIPASAEVRRPPPEIENVTPRSDVWPTIILPFARNVVDIIFSTLLENWVAEGHLGNLWKWLILLLHLFWWKD